MSRLLSALKNLQEQGRFPQPVDSDAGVRPEQPGPAGAASPRDNFAADDDVQATQYASPPLDWTATRRDGGTAVPDGASCWKKIRRSWTWA